MNIRTLLPFGVRAGSGTAGADVVSALTARIYLDRRNARGIGWRGLRPSMSTGHAWTMRLAEQKGVYGLAFLDECCDSDCLRARFSVFYFPDPEEAVLSSYIAEARIAAGRSDYFARIREFTQWQASRWFFLGPMALDLRLGLNGLAFEIEVPVRLRIVAMDGLPEEGVEKGARTCDVPVQRLALPFFRLLTASAASLLESTPQWSVGRSRHPVTAFTGDGDWGSIEGESIPAAILSADFGDPMPPRPKRPAFRKRILTGRALMPKERETEDRRPVLHVVSGFLGAGKTTFLSEWLAWLHNHDRHTAVLQNELGAKSLDSFLLEHETVSETLDDGCVCCTLADAMRPAIRRLLNVLPTEQIILETTGLANPGAVADALEALDDIVRPGLCISLVDACDGEKLCAGGHAGFPGIMGEQIRRADVLVCNKSDRISPQGMARLADLLKSVNPHAAFFSASYGRIPFGELDRLFERAGIRQPAAAASRPAPGGHITHRDEGYASFSVRVTRPMDRESLVNLIRLARDRAPRIKGIVDSVEEQVPMVVQYASGLLSLEAPLSPPGPERFLVLIGKGFDTSFRSLLLRQPGLRNMEASSAPKPSFVPFIAR
jgi:G3E family GTPase